MASLFEKVFKIRIKGKDNSLVSNKELNDFITDLDNDSSNFVNLSAINNFRSLSSDRETQYKLFDQMSEDSIISTALEMYADDATQYNNKGQVIWAESDNTDVAAFANRLIDIFGLNKNAWSHIYSLCKYGDLYLELFRDDELSDEPINSTIGSDSKFIDISIRDRKLGAKLQEYIEVYNNPAEIFEILYKGKTAGFIKSNIIEDTSDPYTANYRYIKQGDKTTVYAADKFVHIALSNNVNRYPERLILEYSDGDEAKEREYKVSRGRSILNDIYKNYRELSLMEDSLLLNRVTRSSIIRLLQIEVGDMPKPQARELLKRVKNLIEQKNFMDKDAGTYSSMASPGPIDNIIYIPTHDGKGTITASNLGGDVDVKSIADIDYYKNKIYAGLKIPRQYMGEEADGGLAGGSSLTKLDARYARTIKRIQTTYIEGITTLINLFALDKGLSSHVNNFTIKMVSPSTIEDQERDESLDNRVNIVSNLMALLAEEGITSVEQRKEILMYFINNYFNEPDVSDIMADDNLADFRSDSSEDINNYEGGSTNFSSPDMSDTDFNMSSDNSSSDTKSNDEMPFEPPTANNSGFGDYSDFA